MKRDSKDNEKPSQMMDDDAPETAGRVEVEAGVSRNCYAAETLVSEVESLFPNATVEYLDPNGRGVALSVWFRVIAMPGESGGDLENLRLALDVVTENSGSVAMTTSSFVQDDLTLTYKVGFHNDPRTQDSRDTFDLIDAFLAASEGDDQ